MTCKELAEASGRVKHPPRKQIAFSEFVYVRMENLEIKNSRVLQENLGLVGVFLLVRAGISLCPTRGFLASSGAWCVSAATHLVTWRVKLGEGFFAAQQGINPPLLMPGGVCAGKQQGQWKRKSVASPEVWAVSEEVWVFSPIMEDDTGEKAVA